MHDLTVSGNGDVAPPDVATVRRLDARRYDKDPTVGYHRRTGKSVAHCMDEEQAGFWNRKRRGASA